MPGSAPATAASGAGGGPRRVRFGGKYSVSYRRSGTESGPEGWLTAQAGRERQEPFCLRCCEAGRAPASRTLSGASTPELSATQVLRSLARSAGSQPGLRETLGPRTHPGTGREGLVQPVQRLPCKDAGLALIPNPTA